MKKQLISIITTFIISSFIYNYDSIFDLFTPPIQTISFKSGEIDKKYFDDIRSSYTIDKKAHKIRNKNTNNFEPMEAFIFDVKDIDHLIHNNKSLSNGVTPDSIAIYFGKDGEDKEPGVLGPKHPKIKMAIIGTKLRSDGKSHYLLDKNINDAPTIKLGAVSIYDKATPCPTNCPQ